MEIHAFFKFSALRERKQCRFRLLSAAQTEKMIFWASQRCEKEIGVFLEESGWGEEEEVLKVTICR
jgi:hypothetical protein